MAQIENRDKSKELLLLIEDAKTKLSLMVRNSFLMLVNRSDLNNKLTSLINDVVGQIKAKGKAFEELANDAKRSLTMYARVQIQNVESRMRQYKILSASFAAIISKMKNNKFPTSKAFEREPIKINITIANSTSTIAERLKLSSADTGYGQMLITDYHKKVQEAMIKLAESSPKVDKLGRKVSLRNKAEMSVRYEAFQNDLETLYQNGSKYVLASQHEDASLRCSPWQGRLYVVDVKPGEEVKAKNYKQWIKGPTRPVRYSGGKYFYSLREAMENGFLGYNCRHRLIEYKEGMNIPKRYDYNSKGAERKRKVDETMRRYERNIRIAKERQVLAITPEERKIWQEESKKLQYNYDTYARLNGRVRNDWRASISKDERTLLSLSSENQNLINVIKNDIINVEIDQLTPCLIRVSDGKIVNTFFELFVPTRQNTRNWEFDWTSEYKKGNIIYALRVENDNRTQGLISLKIDNKDFKSVIVNLVEAAPFNSPHNKNFIKKEYEGVGGHLFAEACKISFEQGLNGYVFFYSKTNLIEHYGKTLGAKLINPITGAMVIEEKEAIKLYEKYYKKRIK